VEVVVAEVFQQDGHDLVAEGGNDLKRIVRLGYYTRLDQVRIRQVRLGQARLGMVRIG